MFAGTLSKQATNKPTSAIDLINVTDNHDCTHQPGDVKGRLSGEHEGATRQNDVSLVSGLVTFGKRLLQNV